MRITTTRHILAALGTLLLTASLVNAHGDEELPPGFQDFPVAGGWNQPLDLAFLPDGRLLVVEKAGLVWMVDGGAKGAAPLLDLSDEVANISSRGLKSIAVDPAFQANGNIYLLYEVDKHHLNNFGTSKYDPLASDLTGPTIGRITRYSLDPATNRETVLAGSRTVLLGETISTGFPIVGAHETGALRFGADGSLLASCGDGSAGIIDTGKTAASAQAILEGIITASVDVGAFRAQMVDTLNGKLLRLDPVTGNGLPGNPFFEASSPRAARSRVWALGFRNPFRFSVEPNSSTGPDHPGRLLIGDVGLGYWEELNISKRGGENFGWPLYEGMQTLPDFFDLEVENPMAPNPLFGPSLESGTVCTSKYFLFKDLLKQETTGALSFPNPCNPEREIQANRFPFMHTRPAIDWGHSTISRAKSFDSFGLATVEPIGAAGSPVAGSQFTGSCVIGGVWYSSGNYPAQYEDSLFIADHTSDWIKRVKLDATGDPTEVLDFGDEVDKLVSLAINPVGGDLYYIQISGEISQLVYQSGNLSPTAGAAGAPRFNPSPSRVTFNPSGSDDPEGLPLSYSWDFGDGTPISRRPSPVHIFPSRDVTPGGTIIAEVLALDPPQLPVAAGLTPSVISDGFYANPSTGKMGQNYLTFYDDPANSDPTDWVGYEYAEKHKFHKLVFQEGREFAPLGGWFDSLTVEARVNGVWTEVNGLNISPPYAANNGLYWETYELLFEAIEGDAIRLIGQGGGTEHFVSIAELRVIDDPGGSSPARHDVTLTVEDSVNQSSQTSVSVWTDNTPPEVTIISPINGGTFDPLSSQDLTLLSTSFDAESDPNELTCSWAISLHHNNHTHPEPLINECSSSFVLTPHGSVNSTFFWEVTLTVSDSLGLSRTATSMLYEETPTMIAEESALSISEGGSAYYRLNVGAEKAGDFYWILASSSGIWPGTDFGSGVIVPLNLDELLLFLLQTAKSPYFDNFRSTFNAEGRAEASFVMPKGSDPSLIGLTLNLAFVGSSVLGEVQYTSNPVQLTFLP